MSAAAAKEAPPPTKKKGKLMIILAIVLVLGGGGAGAGWYFGFRNKHAEKEAEKPKKVVPVYLNLEPFVVNLTGSDNYLQVGVVYALETNAISEAIKSHLPAIRSRVLLRLSAKSVAELGSVEGKQKLTEEIIEDAQQSLEEPQKKGVLTMHFSAFVIQ
jgi:flagellar FliL protein